MASQQYYGNYRIVAQAKPKASSTTYEWSANSASRKLTSDLSLGLSLGPLSMSKQITKAHNPKTDAYRACKNCGKHINFHRNGKCQ